jgi:hypothetical protein
MLAARQKCSNRKSVVDRAEYVKSVCERLGKAKPVPYLEVQFADGSQPEQNCCHRNAERWAREHPGTIVVRGWVDFMPAVSGRRLTAHSVLQDADGWQFDITPIADKGVRPSLRFVPHIGDEQLFQSMKQESIFIDCC